MESREESPEIGGWLWLAALGLLSGLISNVVNAADVLGLLRPGYLSLASPEVKLLLFQLGCCVGLSGYGFYVAWLFYHRKRALPYAYITLLIADLAFFTFDLVLARHLLYFPYDVEGVLPIIRGLIVAAIWIPYFRFSKRVKRTFVQ